jgi:iron complex outermembrane receptor protein
VVTGSRIRRNEFNSISPVQVITTEGSTLAGLVSGSEILQGASVSAGSTQINNQFTGFVVNGGGGVNTVSLRGLGDQRTLVLLNGRRLPPAGTQGAVAAVDLNILPDAIVDRYEILKDGASSIYGSDAVAGVVNVITRNKLDGGRLEASGNFGGGGDGGNEYTFSGAYGKVLDKGRFQISGQYYEQKALKYGDRKDLMCGEQLQLQSDHRRAQRLDRRRHRHVQVPGPVGRAVQLYPGLFGDRRLLRQPGEHGDRRSGLSGQPPIVGAAAADARLPGYRFAPLNDRDSGQRPGEGRRLHLAGQALHALCRRPVRPELRRGVRRVPGPPAQVVADQHPAAVPDHRAGSAVRREPVQLRRRILRQRRPDHSGLGPEPGRSDRRRPLRSAGPGVLTPYKFTQDVTVFRGVLGLRGKFGESLGFLNGWTWDGYASFSKNRGKYSLTGINSREVPGRHRRRLGGPATSRRSARRRRPPHQPVLATQVLQTGNLTPDDYAYLKLTDKGVTDYEQTIAEFTVSGDLFKLPAGPVSGAFGVSYRHDKLDDKPGADLTEPELLQPGHRQPHQGQRHGQGSVRRTGSADPEGAAGRRVPDGQPVGPLCRTTTPTARTTPTRPA